jgi:signal transduction histidine kinase
MDAADQSCRFVSRLALLSKVGALAGTLDYEEVLSAVARLSIPELADWCVVDAVAEGEARRMEVAHRDPARAPLAAAIRAFKLDRAARQRLPMERAVESGRPVLIPEYTDEMLREHLDAEHLELGRQLRACSVLVVPVALPGWVATVTFIMTAESGRRYGQEDVAVAEELVKRAAQVVENARVHQRQKRAQRELAQALAFRDQMMGILGHDLRNPLSAVRALASLLLERRDLPGSVRENVAEIGRAGQRMLEMIGTLLDFTSTRLEGGLPVAPVPADLHEVCRGVVGELQAAEPERTIELDLEGDGRGTWDPARLAQVVSNLVGNALQHGSRHAPVRVSVGGDEENAVLEVRNEGPAISPELLQVMFEPFSRGSSQRDGSRGRGLGLGLYIVSEIVSAHGGTVAVRSSAARGTTFTVRLPRARRGRVPGPGRAWQEGAAAGA